jgi:hypothetical protein
MQALGRQRAPTVVVPGAKRATQCSVQGPRSHAHRAGTLGSGYCLCYYLVAELNMRTARFHCSLSTTLFLGRLNGSPLVCKNCNRLQWAGETGRLVHRGGNHR